MSEGEDTTPQSFSRLDIGIMIVLVSMAVAGLIGLIAVFDAHSDIGAAGTGFGIALLIFETGRRLRAHSPVSSADGSRRCRSAHSWPPASG